MRECRGFVVSGPFQLCVSLVAAQAANPTMEVTIYQAACVKLLLCQGQVLFFNPALSVITSQILDLT